MTSNRLPISKIQFFVAIILAVTCSNAAHTVLGQASTFGGNAQHTGIFSAPAQNLNLIRWQADIDLNNTGALAHYGSPVVTPANTVIFPVKTATDSFRVVGYNGSTGFPKYTLTGDYIMPNHGWIPSYNLCLTSGAFGNRVYFAGAGGTIWHVDNIDSPLTGNFVREVFYTSLNNYVANQTAFNNTVFVNTPITADSNGTIYFGFRVQGVAPDPLNTSQSGIARIDANGNATYVLVGAAAGDPLIDFDSHNLAPALSNDESTVYVAVKASSNTNYAYLLGLNSTTLATKYKKFLQDPRNGNAARVPDDGTSSPMIGPDGDVYFGVFGNPFNGSRGFLLHFSSDLTVTKTPGAFGWDYTPGVVPAAMVPSYHGPSSYLLFTKYNDYAFQDGSGVNRVAILDPNDTQLDPHTSASGLVEMREVMTLIGPTPDDAGLGFPFAVQEFCINAPAINPATNSVFFDSEDGHLYRWNLANNSFAEAVALSPGIGQPYVPSVIGPDGTVYTLNGGNLFAVGSRNEVTVKISSSAPDVRNTVVGTAVTFTATVTGIAPTPVGNVTFTDVSFDGLTPVNTILASNVPLDLNGKAEVTTMTLAANATNRGNHFITATYGGDGVHTTSSVTMVQKVHASATTTALVSSKPFPAIAEPVTFTATVSPAPAGPGVPTGMVTFADGETVIGQVPLNGSGVASIVRSNLGAGTHAITATYASDTTFAASTGQLTQAVGPTAQFVSTTASALESAGHISINVTRNGDTSAGATVDYSTSDTAGASSCGTVAGLASSRCDYLRSVGRISFAAGEATKTISIPIVDDVYAEGAESFQITLIAASGVAIGAPATATLTITDNEVVNGTNPIDQASFFVRQHYIDFLSREPDANGLAFWIGEITSCGNDAQCIEVKRINVSAAFFLSTEFQETGYLSYRTHKVAFNNLAGAPIPVTFSDFIKETQQLSKGVQVGIGDWQTQLENNKQAYFLEFVQRPKFLTAFPNNLTGAQFVSQLNANAGNILSGTQQVELVNILGATPNDFSKRAQVLRLIAEDQKLRDAEFNKAFVLMQYFGYMRRDPNDAPDVNFDGYNFWLTKLITFNGNFVNAEMVKAFIISDEYRKRFGP
jgi:hypothetical protein